MRHFCKRSAWASGSSLSIQKIAAVFLVGAGMSTSAGLGLEEHVNLNTDVVRINTLSSPPDRVSGGDALVEIQLPRSGAFSVLLNGQDITGAFHADGNAKSHTGLVSGLAVGANKLEVKASEKTQAALRLTNYPIQGPIVSGPHLQPFICQTEAFGLPDGSMLGPALDADCSATTQVNYVYMPADRSAFKPLFRTSRLPKDVAKTTTSTGAIVRFIVRIETATINRGIYQSAILHDPTVEPPPSPFSPPAGWNKVLLGVHGGGCAGGWYTQVGTPAIQTMLRAMLSDARRLGHGYALYLNTLQNPSNSCNPFLAGETAMMGKEHFIETYGLPQYSLSTGSSGGAYTTLQVIDAFPGLFDGALIDATYPDALSIALSGMDAHLLRHYFAATRPFGFAEAQQVAVSGYYGRKAWDDAAHQAGRTDAVPHRKDMVEYPSAAWNPVVPERLRYHPVTRPKGARPTIWDVAKNVYGTDPATGFAWRVFDNVGVQYGLNALNAGLISPAQFLDLNRDIGGYDRDNNFVSNRTIGDQKAIVEAYRSGVQLSGGGGLASVPIVDLSGTTNEAAGYHYQWFHFAVRERLLDFNGGSGNHVMWRGERATIADPVIGEQAFALLNRWMVAIQADRSQALPRTKVIRHKPAELVDGCWTKAAPQAFIPERQTFSAPSSTGCNALWPSYAFPRYVAGGPLAANILKCELKPVDSSDYAVTFAPEEAQRLREVFPQGVCDWSKAGVAFQSVDVGHSYGPALSRAR